MIWFKGLGMEKPVWEQIMPEELWKDGNGLCTSFAISVNTMSKIGATYIEYKGTHRAPGPVQTHPFTFRELGVEFTSYPWTRR
jgi:hypothetical protein